MFITSNSSQYSTVKSLQKVYKKVLFQMVVLLNPTHIYSTGNLSQKKKLSQSMLPLNPHDHNIQQVNDCNKSIENFSHNICDIQILTIFFRKAVAIEVWKSSLIKFGTS